MKRGHGARTSKQFDSRDACQTPMDAAFERDQTNPAISQFQEGKNLDHSQPGSSMFDTQITTPSRLLSGEAGGSRSGHGERDEYLMRLLAKGISSKGSQGMMASSAHPTSSGFRIPEPVPPRGPTTVVQSVQVTVASNQNTGIEKDPATQTGAPVTCQCTEVTPGTGGTGQSIQPPARPLDMHEASGWSYAETERYMGHDEAAALRSAVVAHQVSFLEQLYDMHRAIAIQRLLVRTCPEVNHVMSEATRLLRSCSSHHDNAGTGVPPAAKKARSDARRDLHPDSQFAAVPLPGETATATGDGSGDDGDGSGGNGSGGGSTSPQPQAPPVPPSLAALQPAPSGASQTPLAFQGRMGMNAPWVGSPPVATVAAPSTSGYGFPPMPGFAGMYPMPSGTDQGASGYMSNGMDPMTWWYQTYCGSRPTPSMRHGLDMNGLASVPVPMQPPMPSSNAVKWWQDPQQTFGPPADPDFVNQAGAYALHGRSGAPAVEVQSARRRYAVPRMEKSGEPEPKKHASREHDRSVRSWYLRSKDRSPAQKAVGLQGSRSRRPKRKPEDPIDEASSGTTGQDHHHLTGFGDDIANQKHANLMSDKKAPGSVPQSPRGALVQDNNAAQLLLSIRKHGRMA